MKFTYWSNKTKWHDVELLTVTADNITDADAIFKKETNIDPRKCPWVAVSIEFTLDK